MLTFYLEIKIDDNLLYSNSLKGSMQLLKDVDKTFPCTTSDSKSLSHQMEDRTLVMALFFLLINGT